MALNEKNLVRKTLTNIDTTLFMTTVKTGIQMISFVNKSKTSTQELFLTIIDTNGTHELIPPGLILNKGSMLHISLWEVLNDIGDKINGYTNSTDSVVISINGGEL